jgi:transcriptional regulator with XRE-family HTH domain
MVRFVDLKAFRQVNELSQKEVAKFLEVSIAFISSIERGQNKLPAEKLVRLIDNDHGWETAPLLGSNGRGSRIHQDHRTISNNIEGEFNAPVNNNNFNGFSEEVLEQELRRRTELKDYQISSLQAEVERLRQELARERSISDRYLSMLEKRKSRKAEGKE